MLTCRVVPSASRSEIAGFTEEAVRIRIAAPPVDGKANAELERFLAKFLKVPKSAVAVVKGESGKLKKVMVAGIGPEELAKRLEEAK